VNFIYSSLQRCKKICDRMSHAMRFLAVESESWVTCTLCKKVFLTKPTVKQAIEAQLILTNPRNAFMSEIDQTGLFEVEYLVPYLTYNPFGTRYSTSKMLGPRNRGLMLMLWKWQLLIDRMRVSVDDGSSLGSFLSYSATSVLCKNNTTCHLSLI